MLAKDNEYLEEAANSLYVANADVLPEKTQKDGKERWSDL